MTMTPVCQDEAGTDIDKMITGLIFRLRLIMVMGNQSI